HCVILPGDSLVRTDRVLLVLLVLGVAPCLAVAQTPAPPSDLIDYVRKDDKAFAWKLAHNDTTDAGTVYELDLTSQTWHEITWTHKIQVFVPKDVNPQPPILLCN